MIFPAVVWLSFWLLGRTELMTQLSGSLLHPFTRWRFRRRVGGGVGVGVSRQVVLAKLGEPKRRWSDEGNDIWEYEVGRTRKLMCFYSVSFDDDRVCTSWWTESTRKDFDG